MAQRNTLTSLTLHRDEIRVLTLKTFLIKIRLRRQYIRCSQIEPVYLRYLVLSSKVVGRADHPPVASTSAHHLKPALREIPNFSS